MPHFESPPPSPSSSGLIKFTNGRIVRNGVLDTGDLWIDSASGRILEPQKLFYDNRKLPDRTVDLKGRILAPGFIDVQYNGGFQFDLSCVPAGQDMGEFQKGLSEMNEKLVKTGVTSYLATMPSQSASTYHKILPYLGPSGSLRQPSMGAESLGAHCEGPFISTNKRGCHSVGVIEKAASDCSLEALRECFGDENLGFSKLGAAVERTVKMITLAPELPNAVAAIEALKEKGVLVSVGHTEADYYQTVKAVEKGAKMITHLFNAMNSLHHRDPGPFGAITKTKTSAAFDHLSSRQRPYFGIIADGIHLHPASVSLAYSVHPHGLVLVTDAVTFMGCEDGTYQWNNGQRVEKKGAKITLEGTDTIAGSAVTLVECINNFLSWTGSTIVEAVEAVTSTPATMLGLQGTKGSLVPGADADLVILDELNSGDTAPSLVVDEVWKFGSQVFSRNSAS